MGKTFQIYGKKEDRMTASERLIGSAKEAREGRVNLALDRRPIGDRLMGYYNAREIVDWLGAPHPQLGGETALSVIEQGRSEDVHEIIDRLDAANYL